MNGSNAHDHICGRVLTEASGTRRRRGGRFRVLVLFVVLLAVAAAAGAAEDQPPAATDGPVWRALVIGIGEYRDERIPDLATPVADARAVAAVLRKLYGFEVRTLLDGEATWQHIEEGLLSLVGASGPDDSVLIYYGGHGDLDEQGEDGWWYPHDTVPGDHRTFLDNDEIRRRMQQIPARHVLLVSDSCFAGSLFGHYRDAGFNAGDRYHQRLFASRSRLGLTSGGKEPVLDKGGGDHSIFAYHFLKYLTDPVQPIFSVGELFREIAPVVTNNSPQKPEFLPVLNTGHERGEFIFVRNGADLASFVASVAPPPQAEAAAGLMRRPIILVLALGGGALLLAAGAGLLLVRPRLQRRRRTSLLAAACARRDIDAVAVLQASGPLADKGLTARARSLLRPVAGIRLRTGGITVLLAPGPRQGLGRKGPRWALGIADPHISRKPHAWLGFSREQLVVSADGGIVSKGGPDGDEERRLPLQVGDRFALGLKTVLEVIRFVPDRLVVLRVVEGPETGLILAMSSGPAALVDLLPATAGPGELSWRDSRVFLAGGGGQGGHLPHVELPQPILLLDGDLLRYSGRDFMVDLLHLDGAVEAGSGDRHVRAA